MGLQNAAAQQTKEIERDDDWEKKHPALAYV
jgi:hypothetical protein